MSGDHVRYSYVTKYIKYLLSFNISYLNNRNFTFRNLVYSKISRKSDRTIASNKIEELQKKFHNSESAENEFQVVQKQNTSYMDFTDFLYCDFYVENNSKISVL
jgi:hypothetical protein